MGFCQQVPAWGLGPRWAGESKSDPDPRAKLILSFTVLKARPWAGLSGTPRRGCSGTGNKEAGTHKGEAAPSVACRDRGLSENLQGHLLPSLLSQFIASASRSYRISTFERPQSREKVAHHGDIGSKR